MEHTKSSPHLKDQLLTHEEQLKTLEQIGAVETLKTVAEHFKLQAKEAAEAMSEAKIEIKALESIIGVTKHELYDMTIERDKLLDVLNNQVSPTEAKLHTITNDRDNLVVALHQTNEENDDLKDDVKNFTKDAKKKETIIDRQTQRIYALEWLVENMVNNTIKGEPISPSIRNNEYLQLVNEVIGEYPTYHVYAQPFKEEVRKVLNRFVIEHLKSQA